MSCDCSLWNKTRLIFFERTRARRRRHRHNAGRFESAVVLSSRVFRLDALKRHGRRMRTDPVDSRRTPQVYSRRRYARVRSRNRNATAPRPDGATRDFRNGRDSPRRRSFVARQIRICHGARKTSRLERHRLVSEIVNRTRRRTAIYNHVYCNVYTCRRKVRRNDYVSR